MSTQALSPLEQLEQSSQQQPAPTSSSSGLSPLEQLEQQSAKTQQTSTDPEQAASNTRQMLVSGLTGMPTPNMTEQDKASFERGKAAGAVSVPVVAGATLGAPEIAGTAEKFLQISEKALEHLGENYPQLTKLATKLGYGAGAAGAYKLLTKLGLH